MYKRKSIVQKLNCILFIIVSFGQFVLFSCKVDQNVLPDSEAESNEVEDAEEKVGYLLLKMGNASENLSNDNRASLTLDEINSHVEKYELLYFDTQNCQKISLKDVNSKIEVPAGTWNFICLGGSGEDVIGSGYVDSVVIQENEITEVAFSMRSIDVSISTDKEEIYCKDSYGITISVNTKNPYLYLKYVYSSGAINFKGETSSDSVTKAYTAEEEETEKCFNYTTSSLHLKTDTFDCKLDDISGFKGIYDAAVIDKNGVTSLKFLIKEKIVSTGLNMTVSWVE